MQGSDAVPANPAPVRDHLASAARALAITAIAVTVLGLVVRVLTHHVFFDETLHLRFLWRLSAGDRAYRDFFCQYPVTGYFAALPLLRSLPESAYVVLVLRVTSVAAVLATAAILGVHGRRVAGHWAWGALPFLMVAATPAMGNFLVEYNTDVLAMTAAAGALVIFAAPATPRGLAGAATLCAASALVMPKYAPMLLPGGLAYLVVAARTDGWRRSLAVGAAGVAAAFVGAWGLLALHGVSMADMLGAMSLQSRWTIGRSDYDVTVAELTGYFLRRHWPIALLFALGFAGWIAAGRRELARRHLPLLAVLAGTLVYVVRFKSPFEQMLMPVLVVLALLVPWAAALLTPGAKGEPGAAPVARRRVAEVALAVAAIAIAGTGYADAAGGFRQTSWGRDAESPFVGWPTVQPGIDTLRDIDELLKMLPPEERVVAMWFQHPLFRRDLTYVTFDEGDSYTRTMARDGPAFRNFDPRRFEQALAATPPAYVGLLLLDKNYPPGWLEVLLRFLQERAGSYTRVTRPDGGVVFFRNDILARAGRTPR